MEGAAVFRLLLAFAMAPLVWGVGRRLHFPRAGLAFAAAYVFTVVVYAADVLDDVVGGAAFDSIQHVAYVLVAVSTLAACLLARVDVAEAVGPS